MSLRLWRKPTCTMEVSLVSEGAGREQLGSTYGTPLKHLFRNVLNTALVFGPRTILSDKICVSQISPEKLEVSRISETSILVAGDLSGCVPIQLAKGVEKCSAKVCSVGHVRHLIELGWYIVKVN